MVKKFETGYAIFFLSMLSLIASCSKKSNVTAPLPVAVLPSLTCSDVSGVRAPTDISMRFSVKLNKPVTSDASAKYAVMQGTALSPRDFVAASGAVTISAGQTQGYIDIIVKGDSLRQPDLQFTIQFSDPKICTLGTSSSKGTIVCTEGTYLATSNNGYSTPDSYAGYTLAWSDEFSEKSINTNNWNFESGGNGWGNHELEYYTDRIQNAFQSNGNLVIEARNEPFSGSSYTSARMTTQNKKVFKFGRIDIRAKLPVTQGIWPALWMLGSNISSVSWPACGEIDIMELIGLDSKKIYGTGHFANTTGTHDSKGGSFSLTGEDFSQKFHVFSIVWRKDYIEWLIDDQSYNIITSTLVGSAPYPFNNDFFFIFNVATGGDWPGSPDGTTDFPQRMFVDYVRVFQ